MRVAVVYPADTSPHDAIGGYSDLLVTHLRRDAMTDAFRCGPGDLSLLSADVAILQYNPFSYGRRGFAPNLVAAWGRLGSRVDLKVTMVHEPFVPVRDWRSALMGGWQRVQLAGLLAASDRVLISVEGWRRRLAFGRRTAEHAPVASLLPDRRMQRQAVRGALGLTSRDFVVATLGSGHPSTSLAHITAALERLAEGGRRIVSLTLGARARPPAETARFRCIAPGAQSAESLADHLAAADLFLAPLIDGVSTRRTSVMSALQHELAVLGTDGTLTDPVFQTRNGRPWRLVDVAAIDEFARTALELAKHDEGRLAIARAGRAAYEELFDWSVLTDRVLQVVSR